MYAAVWNRAALLMSGVAFGWLLVHWLSTEPERVDGHRANVIVAGVVGIALILWMGLQNPAALLMALFVFGLSALTAYAANARQIGKSEAVVLPLSDLPAPEQSDDRTAIVLAIAGEPADYDGPMPWMRLMKRLEREGSPAPHWFVRPFTCRRIRRTFDTHGPSVSLQPAYDELIGRLELRLGPEYVVRLLRISSPTPPKRAISALASEGFRKLIVLPINLSEEDLELLSEHIGASRVRQAGVSVTVKSVATGWPGLDTRARLAQFARGERPASPPPAPQGLVEQLATSAGATS